MQYTSAAKILVFTSACEINVFGSARRVEVGAEISSVGEVMASNWVCLLTSGREYEPEGVWLTVRL